MNTKFCAIKRAYGMITNETDLDQRPNDVDDNNYRSRTANVNKVTNVEQCKKYN